MEIVVADVAALTDCIAADFQAEAVRAQAGGGRFTIALSGGSVAGTFFPRLAQLAIDWSRCDFFWADERTVPPTDPESNFAVARSLWLDPARVPLSSIHRMPADEVDSEAGARRYASAIGEAAGRPPRFNYLMLGVGPDGHVASLFPGRARHDNGGTLVEVIRDSPKPPPQRMTLTMPVLLAAGRVAIGAFGASKAEAIRDAVENPASDLPAAIVLRGAARALLLLDAAAASLLSRDR